MPSENLIGQNLFGYTLVGRLGSGSFGTVYKAVKENPTGQYIRAVKQITIPSRHQYYSVLNSMNGDEIKTNRYFENLLNDIVSEVSILNDFTQKDVPNVVRYYDNDLTVFDNPRRYQLVILMEYLTPADKFLTNNTLTVRDVVFIGLDILKGLSYCHKYGVIHRDIKLENIFITPIGEFKIGDFGVAKILEDGEKAESIKGTPDYIAPEVFNNLGYNQSIDLYSLGILLYRLLNYNRNPFLPDYPKPFLPQDDALAFNKRMKQEVPKLPLLGGEKLGEVILKAIDTPEKRYQNAEDFLDDLEKAGLQTDDSILNQVINPSTSFYLSEKKKELDDEWTSPLKNARKINLNEKEAIVQTPKTNQKTIIPNNIDEPIEPKTPLRKGILIILLLILGLGIGLYFLFNQFLTTHQEVSPPTYSPQGGYYDNSVNVKINSNDPREVIYYTINGSDPTLESTRYETGDVIRISSTTTLKSIAVDNNGNVSSVSSANYYIESPDDY